MNFTKESERYNGKDSVLITDNAWGKYFFHETTRQKLRFDYSIPKLYGDVLDVGIGDGLGIYLMLKDSNIDKITGIDIHDKALDLVRKNVKGAYSLYNGFAEDMPFDSNTFDSVHLGATLEHVLDDRMVLEECQRVLKGTIVITVPIEWPPDGVQHVRMYKKDSAIELFNEYFKEVSTKMFDSTLVYEGISLTI